MSNTPNGAKSEKLRLRPIFFISVALGGIALLIHFLCMRNPTLADFFVAHISPVFRKSLGYLSVLFPFSLAEAFVITSPALLALLIFFARRAAKKQQKEAIRWQ